MSTPGGGGSPNNRTSPCISTCPNPPTIWRAVHPGLQPALRGGAAAGQLGAAGPPPPPPEGRHHGVGQATGHQQGVWEGGWPGTHGLPISPGLDTSQSTHLSWSHRHAIKCDNCDAKGMNTQHICEAEKITGFTLLTRTQFFKTLAP